MDYAAMSETIRSAKSGDKLKLHFTDRTFEGDLTGRIYMILAMNGRSIQFEEFPTMNFRAVADSGRWNGFRTYIITILDEFDPDYFISKTLGKEMLESIELVN